MKVTQACVLLAGGHTSDFLLYPPVGKRAEEIRGSSLLDEHGLYKEVIKMLALWFIFNNAISLWMRVRIYILWHFSVESHHVTIYISTCHFWGSDNTAHSN